MNQNPEIEKLNKKAKDYSKMLKGIHAEMSKVIVGQDAVIENLILALATQGHVLLKGVPGLAKTLLIKTLADCIDLDFVRLQFTPDLLPADIIGTKIYDHNTTSSQDWVLSCHDKERKINFVCLTLYADLLLLHCL